MGAYNLKLGRSARLGAFVCCFMTVTLAVAGGWPIQAPAASDDAIKAYSEARATDAVGALQKRIDKGGAELKYAEPRGYLDSILRLLNISASSQVLVFSKTSLQLDNISARTPRAIYFNDDVYVGWVQGGDVLEFSAADPQLGAVFYVLPQREEEPHRLVRVTKQCAECHFSKLTGGVPGFLFRSVRVGMDGKPDLTAEAYLTTDQSPFSQRWGGWYVTGTHGGQVHMGNKVPTSGPVPSDMEPPATGNVIDLRPYFDVAPYLTPHSDIVALMVLAHQAHVHNLITKAGYETRAALQYTQGRSGADLDDTARRRIEAAVEPLVRAMVFADEAPLTARVKGTSTFAADFAGRGLKDRKGRSLRDLDLQRRLMRYPFSYLVYSHAFDALPQPALDYAYRRFHEILAGKGLPRIGSADRKAILEILTATKPGFALRPGGVGLSQRKRWAAHTLLRINRSDRNETRTEY